jgi:hypothetical protein
MRFARRKADVQLGSGVFAVLEIGVGTQAVCGTPEVGFQLFELVFVHRLMIAAPSATVARADYGTTARRIERKNRKLRPNGSDPGQRSQA